MRLVVCMDPYMLFADCVDVNEIETRIAAYSEIVVIQIYGIKENAFGILFMYVMLLNACSNWIGIL